MSGGIFGASVFFFKRGSGASSKRAVFGGKVPRKISESQISSSLDSFAGAMFGATGDIGDTSDGESSGFPLWAGGLDGSSTTSVNSMISSFVGVSFIFPPWSFGITIIRL